MVNIIKQEIEVEEVLRKRLEFICEFCSVKTIIILGLYMIVGINKLQKVD